MNNEPQSPQPQPAAPAPAYNPAYAQPDDNFQRMIPTKNMPALLGYYFGVFGLLPFMGLPLAVAAVICGAIGLKKFKQNPTPGAKGHAVTAIALGTFELVCFVVFIVYMVAVSIGDH